MSLGDDWGCNYVRLDDVFVLIRFFIGFCLCLVGLCWFFILVWWVFVFLVVFVYGSVLFGLFMDVFRCVICKVL